MTSKVIIDPHNTGPCVAIRLNEDGSHGKETIITEVATMHFWDGGALLLIELPVPQRPTALDLPPVQQPIPETPVTPAPPPTPDPVP